MQRELQCKCSERKGTEASATCPACGAHRVSFALTRDADYTLATDCAQSMYMAESVLFSPQVHLTTENRVCEQGFTGLWAPLDKLVGFFTVGNSLIALACTSQWDGAAGGRAQVVIANTPRWNRGHARDFLNRIDPLQAAMGEIVTPAPWGGCSMPQTTDLCDCEPAYLADHGSMPQTDDLCASEPCESKPAGLADHGTAPPTPIVMMSRYKDNIYLAFIHVPDDLIVSVKRALVVRLKRIYPIPMKWEPHGDAAVWGDATLTPSMMDNGFSLTRKGCYRTVTCDSATAN